ncbi:MAG: hypothetical protein ACO1RX_08710 [Candidatus Sericytochromatia bacterium]
MLDHALLRRFDAALNQLALCLPPERQPQQPLVTPAQNALQQPIRGFFAGTAWTAVAETPAPVAETTAPEPPARELDTLVLGGVRPLNSALGNYFAQVPWSAPVAEAPVPAKLAQSLQNAHSEALPPVVAGGQHLSVQGFFQHTAWTGSRQGPAVQTDAQPLTVAAPEDDIAHFFSDIHW